MPFAYRGVQKWIIERRRAQALATHAGATRQLVQSLDDFASKLQNFACDVVAVKFLIEFALPPKKRASAEEITLETTETDEHTHTLLQSVASSTTHAATEHDRTASEPIMLPEAHGHAEETKNARDAVERLRQHDDGDVKDLHVVTLSQTAAQDATENFFAFLRKERLDKYVQDMSVGQLVFLFIFHAGLSWQKGKPIELTDRDKFWIPRPTYAAASAVQAQSPPFFVQWVQADATEHCQPRIQPPCACCLCGEGFVTPEALWRHCDEEHRSWAEAVERMLWGAEQLDAIPLMPPDKKRIVQNFAAALTYSHPAQGHFGQNKVCMKQLVACATCAMVDFTDDFFHAIYSKSAPSRSRDAPTQTMMRLSQTIPPRRRRPLQSGIEADS
jgi:hypothetical protein